MIPDLGLLCLALAWGSALGVVWTSFWGGYRQNEALMRAAIGLFSWCALWVVLSFVALCASFLFSDYSVALVARHSHEDMPVFYKLTAVWGNHEGSFLLWILILVLWGALLCRATLPLDYKSRAIGVMGVLLFAFLGFSIFTSNPFERLLPFPAPTGEGLNPLLQDPAMIVHPPMLYLGYVGFAVPFALAMAYLLSPSKKVEQSWARWTRPWALSSWAFLSAGIALGSWWAYYELGWGGFWFWDPVENASLMPWLLATALIHSLRLAQLDAMFYFWSILLAIGCFALSLLGTFLVRSGVLVSVHAFAADPARGVYLLTFLMLCVAIALTLARMRRALMPGRAVNAHASTAPGTFLSSFGTPAYVLMVNNYLLSLSAAIVLIGTLFPLLAHALRGEIWSVGPPYFNVVLTPIFLLLVLLMAEAPVRRQSPRRAIDRFDIGVQLLWSLGFGYLLYQLLAYVGGVYPSWWLVAVLALVVRLGWYSVRIMPGRQAGIGAAHLGFALCALGIVASSYFGAVRDVRMAPGENVVVGKFNFLFVEEAQRNGANYSDQMLVLRAGRLHDQYPQQIEAAKRHYPNSNQVLSEAGIVNVFGYDLYVVPGERHVDGSWSIRIQMKPLVRLIWLGGFAMMLGGLIAIGITAVRDRRQLATSAT